MLLALPLLVLSAALAAQANIAHGAHPVARHHARISVPKPLEAPQLKRRKSCQARNTKSSKATTTKATTTKATTTKTSTSTTHHTTATTKKTTAAAAKPTKAVENVVQAVTSVAGLIKVTVDRCGWNGASKKITSTAGPNGSLDWLNCGITGAGWNPPYMTVGDIVAVDLSQALKSPGTPFSACSNYVGMFEKYADQYGLKAIMLASFAMQESSCNENTIGGAGEQGLMQLTKDKCGGAPGGNCRDPDFNIRTGAKYFSQTLSDNGGNLLLSIGMYNGWSQGLTVGQATAARWTNCCRCQNNLDYLHQFMNGWVQNVNAYSMNLGKYHNLDVCGETD
ncbi:lysozyme-like protein [Mycena vulgaris]|nr:lysozyme-like protein [Mycena vulgaris]